MKPAQPSSADVAAELGITPYTAGWRGKVAGRRAESQLQRDYEAALAAWEASEEGARIMSLEAEYRDLCERLNAEQAAKLRAAGAEYLIDAVRERRLVTSNRGTVAAVFGGKASPLSRAACEALGRQPGPGND